MTTEHAIYQNNELHTWCFVYIASLLQDVLQVVRAYKGEFPRIVVQKCVHLQHYLTYDCAMNLVIKPRMSGFGRTASLLRVVLRLYVHTTSDSLDLSSEMHVFCSFS